MTLPHPGDAIARRDELLELLYWIEGEGFPGAATLDAMTRFLARAADDVRETVTALAQRGDVVLNDDTREYRLTPEGRREAARRFAEQFAPMLGQGHGECHDPACDCHTSPAGAAGCRTRSRPG